MKVLVWLIKFYLAGVAVLIASFLLSLIACLIAKVIDVDKFTYWIEIWMETNNELSVYFRVATCVFVMLVTIYGIIA